MGIEIERKFLVDPTKLPVFDSGAGEEIEQFYIARNPWVRVRILRHLQITTKLAYLTIKGSGDLVRAEFEYPIPPEDAEAMRPFGNGTITKTRWSTSYQDKHWVVDQFHGPLEGLWLAEIELTAPDESFTIPPWVTHEVTTDSRYSNARLVEEGCPIEGQDERWTI